jgi:hypothetical protein
MAADGDTGVGIDVGRLRFRDRGRVIDFVDPTSRDEKLCLNGEGGAYISDNWANSEGEVSAERR